MIDARLSSRADSGFPFADKFGALFRFLRYDIQLETDWLQDTLGVSLSARDLARARRFDDPDIMPLLDDLCRRAAKLQMREADLAAA